MMSGKLRHILKGRRGFSLLEVVLALFIITVVGAAVSTATFQMVRQSAKNRDYTTASQFTMNAVHWISRDAEMSQSIGIGGPTGFPLTLSWVDWGNTTYRVVYTVVNGQLKRSYSVNNGTPVQTLLAESVNMVSENTTCEFSNRTLTLRVTSTVGEGAHAVSVTNMREIFMRSMP
ncbi:MAG: prepilin-type N-terminal cleavage/methylation domain-containing protein [Dehalococcoidales bacterium]|jgi:prepilin-type N-terminal cleavage/methylation domain-containing protein